MGVTIVAARFIVVANIVVDVLYGVVDPRVSVRVVQLASDESADVRLQVAVAARKLQGVDAMKLLVDVLRTSGEDKILPHVVWQNLHPLLEDHSQRFCEILAASDVKQTPALARALAPRPRLAVA